MCMYCPITVQYCVCYCGLMCMSVSLTVSSAPAWLLLYVKDCPHMSQKWLRFNEDMNVCKFTKCARQYNLQQRAKASAIIGKAIVHAASPPLLQMLVGYCRMVM